MISAVPDPGREPAAAPSVHRAACADAARLLALAQLVERPADAPLHWARVAEAIAELLDARGCTIVLADGDHGPARRYGSGDCVVPPGSSGRAMLAAPIAIGDEVVGTVQVCDEPQARPFDTQHVAALRLAALLVGRALHVARVRKLLDSRFAQLALVQAPPQARAASLRDALLAREGIGRLVAKSLYRELTRAGFEPTDVVCVASELISRLSAGLRGAPRTAGAPTAGDASERVAGRDHAGRARRAA